uniref:hypothetical protein RF1 n=1 Tax=Setchellanthus caeruleus TaxID=44592 RepID=UPI001FAF9597|nr:hypothetical protein RF1 [Setchellanthus caeruleus]ULC82855.1 hypothetical protein RF1 [Setchellanthus caeruleus]
MEIEKKGRFVMILKSFILGNLVSLCRKIINSVVVVGLYYGFLTTFSIGPSYLFLLRARVMEEGEEGTEKKVSATTGFIAGQLMMFISIYYAPLHLALGRPHTITVLALPYLLFHFFWNNHKDFFDYGSTTRNSMRNLRIQCVFLNNLIFQLFNHFILPSSMLARLVNIYMFRCNIKILFVTSSFVGWLIGHILFMKWLEFVLVWIQQNNSIRSNVLIRSNKYKYLVSELRNSMARIFSILLFITCVYYLGRIPSPIFTKKLKGTSEREERGGTKEDQEVSTEEDPFPSLFSKEREDLDKIDETEEIRVNGKEKKNKDDEDDEFHVHFKGAYYKYKTVYENLDLDGNQEISNSEIKKEDRNLFFLWLRFEKPLVTLLFDYKRWNRPFRYIKNNQFENAVKNEMSQYFFYTCQNDGKERISFTYLPSLSTFFEMIQKKMPLLLSSDKFQNHWIFTNEQKKSNFKKEFINRIESLDKGFIVQKILEKRTRFCNNEIKKEYLPTKYDPFLDGPFRGRIKKVFSSPIQNKKSIKNTTGIVYINRIHSILLNTNYHKFVETIDTRKRKSLLMENPLSFFSDHRQESEKVDLEDFKDQIKILKFLDEKILKNAIGLKKITKKVSRWSYKLIDDLEQLEGENEENVITDHEIRSRKAKRVVIFTDNQPSNDIMFSNSINETNKSDQKDEVALIRYSQQSDFRRDIIKGSMRAQRRKTFIRELFQANVHSPFFLDRIEKYFFFLFDISSPMKLFFRNLMWKMKKRKMSDSTEEKKKKMDKKEENTSEKSKREEKIRIEIAEAWDSLLFTQVIRGSILVTQSILRKYIILPSLILVKNIGRMLLFQFPEWSEDFKDWNREMHIKCTYNGVQLSEKEFPKNWLTDGIQIKILFPVCLQPWHKSKLRSSDKDPMKKKKGQKNDFCFLTVWGMETELPFGSPRKKSSFFEPIFKEFKKKIRKIKTKCFMLLNILKERAKIFLQISKETKNRIIKNLRFLKGVIKQLSKINPIFLFRLKEIDELNEIKKDSKTSSNQLIHESSVQIRSMKLTTFLRTENKMKDLTERTKTIRNQIEQINKKKNFFLIPISSNKTSYYSKIIKSSEKIWQILKRKNVRLIRKSGSFLKFFIERIYIDFFLYLINIPRMNIQFFLETIKKIIDKYLYNNEINQERINKRNKTTIHFIISNIRNITSKKSSDLSSLSQAYVFYKLSQIQVINLYKLRSILQYQGTSFFLKNEIKDFFEEEGLFHYKYKLKLRSKISLNCERNQWKNWLRNHYQFNFPYIKRPRFMPEKWSNRVNQDWIVQKKDLNKEYSYEKEILIDYKRQNHFETDSVLNQKEQKKNFKKNYKYNFFSYKSINYEYTDTDLICYNSNIDKRKLFGMPIIIPTYLMDNYFREDYFMGMKQIPDRKYLDWRIFNFCFRKNKFWGDNTNNKTEINNYQVIDQIIQKGLSNQKGNSFGWKGMNEKKRNRPILNLELWFFPELVLLYNTYKIKPWTIPIKLLLLNLNENGNLNNKITRNKKKSVQFRLKNTNQEKRESPSQAELKLDEQKKVNVLSNQEKTMENNYIESDIKKGKKKKKYKSNTEAEFHFFLKRYFNFQLRWDSSLNQRILNNIKIYCLLLRLINPREISISSIQRGEMSLDILMIQKNLTLPELIKKGILIIEPVRLSIKNDRQFILYQTIKIALVQKNKHKNKNKRYQEKPYVDKKNFDEFSLRCQRVTGNREKNHDNFFVPENILSSKRCREFRILISLNSKNRNDMHHSVQVLNKRKNLNRNTLLKVFLWPNFRLEDLACMNRYWFNTTNGSRFSMVRISMYPRLQIF